MSPLDEPSRSDRGADTETARARESGDGRQPASEAHPADGSQPAEGAQAADGGHPAGGGPPPDAPADARNDGKAPRQPQTLLSVVRETAVLVVLAILLAVLFKTFLVQAFYIPSGSMEPTLNVSDRVLVEKVSYRFGNVRDGDVVVFVHDLPGVAPESGNVVTRFFSDLGQAVGVAPPSSRDFIKRVVGTPGDRISCQQGKLYRNDRPVSEPYLAPGTTTQNCTPTTVRPGQLYVMGDNRNNSEDSRTFGPIARSSVVGRAFVRIWPLSHTGWLRRDR
jgi:signal peptidase I